VVAFLAGVSAGRREAILNSVLLAQLVATQRVGDQRPVHDWYEQYLGVLGNIGWHVRDMGFATLQETTEDFDVQDEILKVAATLLGPAALATVSSMLKSLDSVSDMKTETVFDRDACHGNTARFQIGVAEQDSEGRLLVSLMGFALTAKRTLTRALHVKGKRNDVMLNYTAARTSIDTTVLDSVRELIAAKLGERTRQYVTKLPSV
jgi:hypothetical protein